jgi:hypothetical protein
MPQAAIFDELCAMWTGFRGDKKLPARSAFDPFVLKKWLSQIAIVELVADPPRLRVRLAGTAINRYVGADLTGKFLDEVLPTIARSDRVSRCLEIYERAMHSRTPQHDSLPLAPRETTAVTLHRLVLPCGADGEVVDSFVVAMVGEASSSSGGYF